MVRLPALLALAALGAACSARPGAPPLGGKPSLDLPLGGTGPALFAGSPGGGARPPGGPRSSTPAPAASRPPPGTRLAEIAVGSGPRGLAADAQGRVWVAVRGGGSVVRLAGDSFADTVSVDRPGDLVFDAGGRLWVAAAGGVLGFAGTDQLSGAAGAQAEAVAAAGDFLYASFPEEDLVRRYRMTPAGLADATAMPDSGGRPRDLLVDPAGRLWVALAGTGLVARYDRPADDLAAPALIAGPAGVAGLALADGGRVLALGNATLMDVTASPPATRVADGLLDGAFRMAADRGGTVWAAANPGNRLVGVGADGTLLPESPVGLAGPWDVLVDATGDVWVSNEAGGTVMQFAGS